MIIVSYTIVRPCCLSLLCIVVSANPEFLICLFLHTPVPFGNYKFFFLWLRMCFCFVNKFICINFLDSTYKYIIYLSVSDLLHLV